MGGAWGAGTLPSINNLMVRPPFCDFCADPLRSACANLPLPQDNLCTTDKPRGERSLPVFIAIGVMPSKEIKRKKKKMKAKVKKKSGH